jgi:hypothetical protein
VGGQKLHHQIVDLEPVRLEQFTRAAREADPQEGFRA